MEVLVAFAGVFDRSEIAVGIVGIATLINAAFLLADAVGLEAALLVIVVMAEQCALLAVLFTSARVGIGGPLVADHSGQWRLAGRHYDSGSQAGCHPAGGNG